STAIGNNAGQKVVEAREISKANRDKIIEVKRDGQYTVYVYNGREMAFYSRKIKEIDGELTPSMQLSNIWTDTPYEGIASEGGVKLKGGKKPEKLIKRIIELSTDPDDLVMDFFLGSGTTAAVAHKIGRKYIGCEQLDTHIEMILDRLKAVVDGEQTGISKISNWQGGGSFVYCELKELNESYISKIQSASNQDELLQLKTEICNSGFVSHKIDLKDFRADNAAFTQLSLDEQKNILLNLLDKNEMYVNYCDIEDEEMNVNKIDMTFTNNFYSKEIK
ncbi:MAG: DNA methyltransferase, partial [Halanaerobiales bacterium]